MKSKNKSLLIHQDKNTNQASVVIVDESNIVKETKAFIKKLAKNHSSAKVQIYQPVGVVLKATGDGQEYAKAVAYEKEKFIIVEPNGTSELAKLYGDWNEALTNAHRFLNKSRDTNKKIRIVLDRYFKKD